MSFFNKKEDVMKIELTPHGRNLLMKGELKPEFYAFFDDDILYDSSAGGFNEEGTDAKIRIISNTPSLKPQTTFTGVESKINNANTIEDDNILINPIGTNKSTSKKTNGWEVSVGVLGVDKYIDSDYLSSELASDDTFVKLTTEKLLLHVLEKNGFSYKDSLSLQVYKYDPDEVYYSQLQYGELTDMDLSLTDQEELSDIEHSNEAFASGKIPSTNIIGFDATFSDGLR